MNVKGETIHCYLPPRLRPSQTYLRIDPSPRPGAPRRLSCGRGDERGGVDSGRQAYSRLTDDKRVIYYRELPAGTAPPSARRRPRPLRLALGATGAFFPARPASLPHRGLRWRLFKLPTLPPPPPRALFEGRSISIMAPTPTTDFSHALSALYAVLEAHESGYVWSTTRVTCAYGLTVRISAISRIERSVADFSAGALRDARSRSFANPAERERATLNRP